MFTAYQSPAHPRHITIVAALLYAELQSLHCSVGAHLLLICCPDTTYSSSVIMYCIGKSVGIVISVVIGHCDISEIDPNKVIQTQFRHRFGSEVTPVMERRNYHQPEQDYYRKKWYRPRDRLRSFYKKDKPRVSRYSVFYPSR